MKEQFQIIDDTTVKGTSLITPDLRNTINNKLNWYSYNLGYFDMALKELDVYNYIVTENYNEFPKSRIVIHLFLYNEINKKIITNVPDSLPKAGIYYNSMLSFNEFIDENEITIIDDKYEGEDTFKIMDKIRQYDDYCEKFIKDNRNQGIFLTINGQQDTEIMSYIGIRIGEKFYCKPHIANPALIFRNKMFRVWLDNFDLNN